MDILDGILGIEEISSNDLSPKEEMSLSEVSPREVSLSENTESEAGSPRAELVMPDPQEFIDQSSSYEPNTNPEECREQFADENGDDKVKEVENHERQTESADTLNEPENERGRGANKQSSNSRSRSRDNSSKYNPSDRSYDNKFDRNRSRKQNDMFDVTEMTYEEYVKKHYEKCRESFMFENGFILGPNGQWMPAQMGMYSHGGYQHQNYMGRGNYGGGYRGGRGRGRGGGYYYNNYNSR